MGRELPVWFKEFKEKMKILDKYWLLSNEEICAKRDEIRQKIQELEDSLDKVSIHNNNIKVRLKTEHEVTLKFNIG